MSEPNLASLLAMIRGDLPISEPLKARKCLRDDQGDWRSYGDVVEDAKAIALSLKTPNGGVALVPVRNQVHDTLVLLACWAVGLATLVIDPDQSNDSRKEIMEAFKPDVLYDAEEGLVRKLGGTAESVVYRELLLSTSGTTGTKKFVRLPDSALFANALQIADALAIDADSVACAHLPLHYSYGLSVLLSHLERGAAIFLTEKKITSPDFAGALGMANATHFPGVPFHYSVLARLGLDKIIPPCVTTFTQAGGHLELKYRNLIYERVCARDGKFFVMYGQTEAAPRIATLPHDVFPRKPESVGRALKGGKLLIVDENENELPANKVGEVVYRGPNVMSGYATSRSCLKNGDEMQGRLKTGDLGRLDEEGDLFIVGRNKRFAKVVGLRIALEEIEKRLRPDFEVILMAGDEAIIVFYTDKEQTLAERLSLIASDYRIPARYFIRKKIASVPILSNGKVDFAHLRALI